MALCGMLHRKRVTQQSSIELVFFEMELLTMGCRTEEGTNSVHSKIPISVLTLMTTYIQVGNVLSKLLHLIESFFRPLFICRLDSEQQKTTTPK